MRCSTPEEEEVHFKYISGSCSESIVVNQENRGGGGGGGGGREGGGGGGGEVGITGGKSIDGEGLQRACPSILIREVSPPYRSARASV
ncbi:hypothetical protein KOW79_003112 [Hemibagrus wyckioides]|uniref:Uncharacterized protein n=1 Tax=Hemibagrus wyckioides TaxID=337641 RepID=A0A9D3SQM9_9TELE|nr:hypothetical protein KOW79_003112 [Hemibagrus wyckioides]